VAALVLDVVEVPGVGLCEELAVAEGEVEDEVVAVLELQQALDVRHGLRLGSSENSSRRTRPPHHVGQLVDELITRGLDQHFLLYFQVFPW